MAQAAQKRVRLVAGHRHGRVPRLVREAQILEVAKQLFATKGYPKTSIEDIARDAGVTRPIIYDHFGSKDDVYLACVRQARDELEVIFANATAASDDPGEQLWAAFNAYFEFIERDTAAWEVLFGPGATAAGPAGLKVADLRFDTVRLIAGLIAPAVPQVDAQAVEAMAHFLSGAGEQLAKWWRRNPQIAREQVAGYAMAFSWFGLERLVAEDQKP
jgi:AcrR family transcriptional regulator